MAYLSVDRVEKSVSFEIEFKLVRGSDAEPWVLQPVKGIEDFGQHLHFPVLQNGFARDAIKGEFLKYLDEYFASALLSIIDCVPATSITQLVRLERGERSNFVYALPFLRKENGSAKAAQERNLTIRITDDELRSCRIP